MLYKIDWLENKKDDWKVATLIEATEGGQAINDVSLNSPDRQGRTFKDFAQFGIGTMVEGNLWKNQTTGKYTLFAPDAPRPVATASSNPRAAGAPPSTPYRGGGNTGMKAAQERKTEAIANAQENKSKGIMVSSSMRDSTIITTELIKQGPPDWSLEDFQMLFKRVQAWYLKTWKDTEASQDVPF